MKMITSECWEQNKKLPWKPRRWKGKEPIPMNFENILTNAQTRFAIAVLVGVVEPSHIARHTRQCPCISVAQDATHEACQGSDTKVRW